MLDIAHQRLANQCIARPMPGQPADVVAWLTAVQAQDYAGAKWALGLRLQEAQDEDVERAFTDGAILRTHLLRPTWHFVTPADIRWLLTLTAPRVHAVNAYMYRKLQLDQGVFARSHDALVKALQGGKRLTREELGGVLEQAGVATRGPLRLAYILMAAELDGIVCSGPRRGKQFTYMLLEERVPAAKAVARDEALAALVKRYFVSRGPATPHDFVKWSGLTLADARRGLAIGKSDLAHEVMDGKTYWLRPPLPAPSETSPRGYLLSIYDEYMSSYKDLSAIGGAETGAQLAALGNALQSIVVVNGYIVGTWKRTVSKSTVTVETSIFTPLTEAEHEAVAVAARRYGSFLSRAAALVSRPGQNPTPA